MGGRRPEACGFFPGAIGGDRDCAGLRDLKAHMQVPWAGAEPAASSLRGRCAADASPNGETDSPGSCSLVCSVFNFVTWNFFHSEIPISITPAGITLLVVSNASLVGDLSPQE